jgi:predicted O-linked N-acetylglucosamine transferase (SPINDLY family)
MDSLIASNIDEYKSIAVDLYRNPERILQVKRKLQYAAPRSKLFDSVRYTKSLEQLYIDLESNQ